MPDSNDQVTSNIFGRHLATRDEDLDAMLPSNSADIDEFHHSTLNISAASKFDVFGLSSIIGCCAARF